MVWQKAARWPCGVCNKGVGSNSLQCTRCQKWVHKKCSGIKGSMSKVAKSFICSGCLNPVTSAGRTHTRLTALFPGLPGSAGTRKVKPIWILLKQETVSGSGISWAYASLHLAPDG